MTGSYFKDISVTEKFKKVKSGAIEISAGFVKDGDIHFSYGLSFFQELDFFFSQKISDIYKSGKTIQLLKTIYSLLSNYRI